MVDLLMVFYLCLVVYGFGLPIFVLLLRWIAKYIEDDYIPIRTVFYFTVAIYTMLAVMFLVIFRDAITFLVFVGFLVLLVLFMKILKIHIR